MPELYLPSQDDGTAWRGDFAVRISPVLAMTMTLPMVELAPRFPGIDPWLAQLSARLGRTARADLRLLCVPLSGALSLLFEVEDEEESPQPVFDALAAMSPSDLLHRVVQRLAAETDDHDPDTVLRWIEHEPERIIAVMESMERPHADEPFEIDAGRALSLMRHPAELKSLVELRLRQLWHDHFAPRWRDALPTCRALAEEARRRFYLGEPERVLEAIIGRRAHNRLPAFRGKRLVFVPIPFAGPYVATAAVPEYHIAYIGFGVVHGAQGGDVSEEAAQRDLLAALTALADEARLKAVAYIRAHGEARAADLMKEFGWSQPATSRHLRALESTGLLHVERIDGVKRYTINRVRARSLARSLELFLTRD